jgi:glutamate synthase (NADPH) small chain
MKTSVNKMKPSERMKIPRQSSLEQQPDERKRNFTEVSFGVDEERALLEAARCLECQNPVCQEGCPVNIDIRSFVQLVYQKDYVGAVNKIRESNYLPAICGRVRLRQSTAPIGQAMQSTQRPHRPIPCPARAPC